MNKGLRLLLKRLKELYTSVNIKKIALNTKFMKRESKITPEIFLSLCLFSGEDLCRSTLLDLRTRLASETFALTRVTVTCRNILS